MIAEISDNLQLFQLLAELPGVRADRGDGVLADPQHTQCAQPIQPALVHLCQVVVLQLPANTTYCITICLKTPDCIFSEIHKEVPRNIVGITNEGEIPGTSCGLNKIQTTWTISAGTSNRTSGPHFSKQHKPALLPEDSVIRAPKSPLKHSQFLHVIESKEGAVHQLGDAVALHLQKSQGVQTLKGQAVHHFNLVAL